MEGWYSSAAVFVISERTVDGGGGKGVLVSKGVSVLVFSA